MIRRLWSRLKTPVVFDFSLSRRDWKWIGAGGVLALALLATLYWPTKLISNWVTIPVKANPTVVVVPQPGAAAKPSPPPVHVKGEDRVVQLETKSSLGHACPISPTEALTAEHVALKEDFQGGSNVKQAPYVIWGDMLGNTGTVQWQWSDVRRDLSLVRVVPGTPPFAAYLRRATAAPAIGEKVYVVGYDWTGGLGDYTVEATVLGNRAGSLVYSNTPGPGSSGGCVLNAQGEFVAINVASVKGSGLGVLVVGEWATVPDMFRDGEL